MESHKITIVGVNARSGNDRPAKVASDILDDLIGIAFIGHSSDIEPIFLVCIDAGFYFFEGIPQSFV